MPQEIKRTYNYSDGTLKQKCDLLVLNLMRDAAEFAARGETPATVTNFQNLIDDFDAFATDEELEGIEINQTKIKDGFATTLRVNIRTIRGIAQAVYETTGLYNSFGFTEMDGLDDAHLHRLAKRVVRVSTTLLGDMKPKGLTQVMIDDVQNTDTSFDKALDNQKAAEETRDIATQQRAILGNNLFAEYSRLMNTGKTIFEDNDEAKYNDYVMNDNTPAPPPPPPAP